MCYPQPVDGSWGQARTVLGPSTQHRGGRSLISPTWPMARSQLEGLSVRVVRGAHPASVHGPSQGFRYDGLFRVVDHWPQTGADGYASTASAWWPWRAWTHRRPRCRISPLRPAALRPSSSESSAAHPSQSRSRTSTTTGAKSAACNS